MKLVHVSVLAVAGALAAITGARADTFIVTTTQDSGAGSFRWAVEQSNSHVGPDTVLFAIPASDSGYYPALGVWTIRAGGGYRIEDGGTFVDGFSQGRFIGGDPNPLGPEIELEGPDGYPASFCLRTHTDHHVILGLCIHGFVGGAVRISGWPPGELAEDNVVAGCYLNVDPAGSQRLGAGQVGVDARDATALRIGGDAAEDRNIIVPGLGCDYCGDVQITNNIIGADRTGTVGFAANPVTVVIYGTRGPHVVRDNLIGGYSYGGLVEIAATDPDSGFVTFIGNRVGVGLDGSPITADRDLITLFWAPGHLFRDNVIAYGDWFGMELHYDETDYVTISRNSVYGCYRLGIQLVNLDTENLSCVDYVDGVYGPGVNEEIDPPLCESIISSSEGDGGTTTACLRCMSDCVVEVFMGDPGVGYSCSEAGFGDVHSGMTYLGDAEEVAVGSPWSTYRLSISPALPVGTFVTATATNQNGSTSEFGCSCRVPGQSTSSDGCLPSGYSFAAPSPNPCTGTIVLRYELPERARAQIMAYDIAGNLVATILDDHRAAGVHGIEWNAEQREGEPLPSGLYVLRLVSDGFVASRRVVVSE